ncbi:ABC transporter permease/substrate-binding protein [Mucisphaera calidilacus]|uniref:Choline transport system permease protein OpuBB n=1 Tax=Mucisphaera calidilacus TaxID=2527982 RepID=A0A518BTY0_9BACT|nr:ABC transporter permease/substrate-binding protein [Mucisphaera calidilacus]QDU70414.1 Choline transport system permease protein OpuBB [Mucisphaera calidilacus]
MADWLLHLEGTPRLLAWHVLLVLIAIGLASAISIPLGIALARKHPRTRAVILGIASILQTIPGLAFLALIFMLLVLANNTIQQLTASDNALFRSIGLLPTIIALTLYAILPILRNTIVGIRGIDHRLIEAADAMGLTTTQRRQHLELPLAAPVILAGIRTATVWTVGIATLSTLIGQPSLGDPIIAGLQTINAMQVIVGCILASILAILLDGTLAWIESSVANRNKPALITASATLAATAIAALLWLAPAAASDKPAFEVGAKNFNESYILGHLIGQVLEDDYNISYRMGMGSTVVFEALSNSEIDAYVDYSGTIWATVMGQQDLVPKDDMRNAVQEWLRDEKNITCLDSLGFENAYALAIRRSLAEELGITTIEDLARHADQLSIASDQEFFARPEWQRLLDTYSMTFAAQVSMQSAIMYQAAGSGEVDVITAYTTDGRVDTYDLLVLEDPRQAFPPYEALILLSPDAGSDPTVINQLTPLVNTISMQQMRAINRRVDEDGILPQHAATELLSQIDTETRE